MKLVQSTEPSAANNDIITNLSNQAQQFISSIDPSLINQWIDIVISWIPNDNGIRDQVDAFYSAFIE